MDAFFPASHTNTFTQSSQSTHPMSSEYQDHHTENGSKSFKACYNEIVIFKLKFLVSHLEECALNPAVL
jgi:hypothetical protein